MRLESFARPRWYAAVLGVFLVPLAEHAWGNGLPRWERESFANDAERLNPPSLYPRGISTGNEEKANLRLEWGLPLGQKAPFVVRRDAAEEHSRIIIPRKCLPSRSVLQGFKQSLNSPQQKATRAGVLLTTVLCGGGLTVAFVRRRRIGAAVTASVGMLVVSLTIGTAMAGPVLEAKPSSTPVPSAGLPPASSVAPLRSLSPKKGGPQIAVEVTESGEEIILVLGKNAPAIGP